MEQLLLMASDIWQLISDATPVPIRWAFGVITGALVILVAWLFKRQRKDIARLHYRIDNLEGTLDQQRWHTQRELVRIALCVSRETLAEPSEQGPCNANGGKDS